MIYVVVGEDKFQRDSMVAQIVGDRHSRTIDGDGVELSDLPTIFLGQTMFDSDQVLIIDGLSGNKAVWSELTAWLEREISSDVVLSELSLDKRQSVYKKLHSKAKIVACDPRRLGNTRDAEDWLLDELRARQLELPRNVVSEIVRRATRPSVIDGKLMIDRVRILTVLEQIVSWQGEFTIDLLDTVMYPSVHENVFTLLTTAFEGRRDVLRAMLDNMQKSEDGFKIFGLLISQIISTLAINYGADQGVDQIASDFKLNPYALRPLVKYSRRLSRTQAENILSYAGQADEYLKTGTDPWEAISLLLNKIAGEV